MLKEIFIERTLDIYKAGEKTGELHLFIGRPFTMPPHNDWQCPYKIVGIGKGQEKMTMGVDSFQSLLLCLEKINVELHYYMREMDVEFKWLGMDSLGFENVFKAQI